MLGCISCKRNNMSGLFSCAVQLVREACEMLVSVTALTSASTKGFVSQDFLKCEKGVFFFFVLLTQLDFLRVWTLCTSVNPVNSSPVPPPLPPGLTPGHQHFFFTLDCKFPGMGALELSNPPGRDEKRGQMPRPPSTLQHVSLIAQSSSTILSILMCDFLFQLTSFFVIVLF